MDKKPTTTVIFTDNPPFNQKGEIEKKEVKPEADSLYGGNPAVMADAIEQMKNVRKLLKDRLKGVKDNIETFADMNATEKVRLQGSKESKIPSLKPYTEAVDVKDRAALSQLVEKAKKEKKLFKIGRSMKEGFRYTFLIEEMVKEEAKPEFKVGSTVKIISMAGEPEYTGKVGKITKIDDAGQLHGTWGGLALIPGDDKFELVTVINHDTGKIEEKKYMMEDMGEGFGTKLTSFEQAKELGKGAMWPVSADEKYFDMYHDKGYELFVKGMGKDRILTVVRKGDVVNAFDINDKLVVLEKVMPAMKTMPKMEGAPEEHHHDEEHKDEGEYDEEGDMAKSDLQIMADAALELHGLLADEENLPEWVQAKITLATDYIDTARDYMKAKKDGLEFPEPKEDEETDTETIVELEPLKEAATGSWGKEVITLQDFATAVEKLGRDDIDVFPILKGIAAGTHRAFVKHEGKDATITVLRGDVVEMTLTSKKEEAVTPLKEESKEKLLFARATASYYQVGVGKTQKEANEDAIDALSKAFREDNIDVMSEGNIETEAITKEQSGMDDETIKGILGEDLEEALVEPKKGESEADYVSRFMGTKLASKDFPNQKQRLAVAYGKFNAAKGKKEEMEIKDTKFFPGEDGDTEANMFIEEHGIEDFGLTWDDAKGGYMLTWTSKEEILEAKGKVSISDVQEIQKELDEMSAGDNDYALGLIQELLSLLGEGGVSTSKVGSGDIGQFQDLVMETSAQDEKYAVALLHELENIFEVVEEKLQEAKVTHKKELKEDTTILSNLNEFEPWSGAVSTWELIVEADKVDALDFMLEDLYPEGMTSTELNDLLWFESDWIIDMLGISRDTEMSDEESDEENDGEEPKAKPERELIALDDLDEEPVVFDIDELEESKHMHSKEEVKMGSGNIVKEVQDFITKTVGK